MASALPCAVVDLKARVYSYMARVRAHLWMQAEA